MDYRCKNAVLLIFFNRPETLQLVFEKVKKAKPPKLFLVQDGARDSRDLERILACREIVENVDWDCEVIKDYSETNLGCGMRPQTGITNALKQVEQVIILEDDCVPADSAFRYFDEMLEKYRDDERICYISGLNHFQEWVTQDSDYLFTKTGAIWGWATWRRAWALYDYGLDNFNKVSNKKLLQGQISNKSTAKEKIDTWSKTYKAVKNNTKLSYWDIQWGYVKYSQNMLVVVPRVNQISNIGIGEYSTHAQSHKSSKFKKRKNFFFIPTQNFEFPLKHPEIMVCDEKYDKLVYKCAQGNSVRRFFAKAYKKIFKK